MLAGLRGLYILCGLSKRCMKSSEGAGTVRRQPGSQFVEILVPISVCGLRMPTRPGLAKLADHGSALGVHVWTVFRRPKGTTTLWA